MSDPSAQDIASTQDTVTAVDIVQQQLLLEQEAWETLPGKFEECNYSKGYIRQPLYACRTCSTGDDMAGMCYSCSIACHSDHEVLELFPKRQFRCDCGLSTKFGGHPCELDSSKRDAKNKNKYNHNFLGRYCRCDKFYDPDQEEDVMFQCLVCEDWFHERCIGEIPPAISGFESYLCRQCTEHHPFLVSKDPHFHVGLAKGEDKIHTWIQANLDITEEDKKRKLETDSDSPASKRQKAEEQALSTGTKETCKNVAYSTDERVEVFLDAGWQEGLCRCEKCKHSMETHGLDFLNEHEQTVEPEDDEDAGKSLLDVGMEKLQSMDRIKAMDGILAYRTLANQVKEYLQTFRDSNKVVTEQDIRRFFDRKLEERKEQAHF